MTSARDKLLDLNQQNLNQNNKIKNITRTANEALEIKHNTLRELDDQVNKIQGAIDLNDEIKDNIKKANEKTSQMRRRNICIKISLYFSVLCLFAAVVVSIIVKVKK